MEILELELWPETTMVLALLGLLPETIGFYPLKRLKLGLLGLLSNLQFVVDGTVLSLKLIVPTCTHILLILNAALLNVDPLSMITGNVLAHSLAKHAIGSAEGSLPLPFPSCELVLADLPQAHQLYTIHTSQKDIFNEYFMPLAYICNMQISIEIKD
ncbi:UNVERIFIED_CONTAM: hypothetical protein Sradi_6215900 [Sesamum radiatum]|uniref:Uncharacterized protein n=1 Tax=Sesamum radiatum TaxID=300843 RepID=A0AAW2KAT1_SESRA